MLLLSFGKMALTGLLQLLFALSFCFFHSMEMDSQLWAEPFHLTQALVRPKMFATVFYQPY